MVERKKGFSGFGSLNAKVLKWWLLRTFILGIIFAIVFQAFDLWAKRTHIYVIGVSMGLFYSFYRGWKEYPKNKK